MDLTRRQFLLGGLSGISAVASPAFARLSETFATLEPASGNTSAHAFSILSRLGYGPTPAEREEFARLGLKRYLQAQLNPSEKEDGACQERISRATLHIEYKPSKPEDGYQALKEDRPLKTLNQPVSELWKLADGSIKMDGRERHRPAQEVRAATWIRAVHSKWQLREVMTDFWHNHFNVSAFSDNRIAATFPVYDAMIRKQCFGNFRAMLEDVAQSTAMLFFLNNAKSRASPANENYARELFELHTLGADHYYNDLYNRWREVPGALKGKPIGYIDQDVYEAARAFTGWTVEDGANTGRGTIFPKTGQFTYFDGWHDNYQKRVLGTEFDPNAPPMADGRKVLDLVAAHSGTAIHLCTKLCRRFVCDDPPEVLVKKAVAVWQKNLHHPRQVALVLQAIILSPEFAAYDRRKVKRPLEFVASFLRTAGAEVTPQEQLFNRVSAAGYRQFEWPTPTGHPDVAEYWLNTNATLASWNLLPALFNPGFKSAHFDLAAQTPANVKTSDQIIAYWVERMTGRLPGEQLRMALMQYMPEPSNAEFVPDIRHPSFAEPYQQMAMVIGMLPDFQVR